MYLYIVKPAYTRRDLTGIILWSSIVTDPDSTHPENIKHKCFCICSYKRACCILWVSAYAWSNAYE